MPVEVILPKVDMDMATGQISRWFVEEGASVKQGDVLFEIETDKAAMEIDAPASGILRNITGKERVDIPVGQAVAWIYAEGEAAGAPAVAPPAGETSAKPVEAAAALPVSNQGMAEPSASLGISSTRVESDGGGVRATPLARRLAREAGLDLASVSGTGPHGRVVKADVEAAIKSPPSGLPAISPSRGEISLSPTSKLPISPLEGEMAGRPEGGANLPVDDAVLKLFEQGSYELVPHDNMRKTIARRLVEAKST
ncbi:E3 binding domain-containing protein, partial [Mesorhizobium sp. Root552]|uniref:E3 binding domain-containing protein n=1 Tax=Mesorhizobium sp. Root552 TaxID=1736555 RepID=UPI0012E7A74C